MSELPSFSRGEAEEEIQRWQAFVTYAKRMLQDLPQRSHVSRDLEKLVAASEQYTVELAAAKEQLPE